MLWIEANRNPPPGARVATLSRTSPRMAAGVPKLSSSLSSVPPKNPRSLPNSRLRRLQLHPAGGVLHRVEPLHAHVDEVRDQVVDRAVRVHVDPRVRQAVDVVDEAPEEGLEDGAEGLRREEQALLAAEVVTDPDQQGMRRRLAEQQRVERDVVLLQHPLGQGLGVAGIEREVHEVLLGPAQAAGDLVDAPRPVHAQAVSLRVEALCPGAQTGHSRPGELREAVGIQLVPAPLAQWRAGLVEEASRGDEAAPELVRVRLGVRAPLHVRLDRQEPEEVDVEPAQKVWVRLHDLEDAIDERSLPLGGEPERAQQVPVGDAVQRAGRPAHRQRDAVALSMVEAGRNAPAVRVVAHRLLHRHPPPRRVRDFMTQTPTMWVRPWLSYRSVQVG